MAKTDMSEADRSAQAQITKTLSQFGLGALGTWAWNEWKQGKSIEQIYLDMRDTPEYKTRFPAMKELSAKGHALTEKEYVQLEQTYTGYAHNAGFPDGFLDKDELTALIAGEVSPTEFKTRVDGAAMAVYSAPAETRAELERLYGVTPGQLTAYWLNPDKALPLIQKQFLAATSAGQATRAGFGSLNMTEAERIASFGLTPEATEKGFSDLVREKELFKPLPGEFGSDITRQQQLDAALGGDAEEQLRIEKRAGERVGAFQDKSREYAGTAKGLSGLGENPT
jgi:hypothetical protein